MAVGSGGPRGGRADGVRDTPAGFGHHSSAEYDRSRLVALEGEAVSVLWRNPHVLIEVAALDAGSSAWTVDPERARNARASGIFRVWSRGPGVGPWHFREAEAFRLTEWATARAAQFDPLEDNPLLDCTVE